MILYPAIDIMNGQCVRLHKGDFAQATIYDSDPFAMAELFAAQGASWIHIADLDGARDSSKRQTALISQIVSRTDLSVQTGGGVRGMKDVEELLAAGAKRVVVGSLAVKQPEVVKDMMRLFGPEALCLAMDVMPDSDGVFKVVVSGWQEETAVTLNELIRLYRAEGLQSVLCTDVSRDGTLEGVNVDLYNELVRHYPGLDVLASGGVNGLDDLRALQAIPAGGVVIGKALYEGVFTFAEALDAC